MVQYGDDTFMHPSGSCLLSPSPYVHPIYLVETKLSLGGPHRLVKTVLLAERVGEGHPLEDRGPVNRIAFDLQISSTFARDVELVGEELYQ